MQLQLPALATSYTKPESESRNHWSKQACAKIGEPENAQLAEPVGLSLGFTSVQLTNSLTTWHSYFNLSDSIQTFVLSVLS